MVAWENSRHLSTLPLVSPPNGVWETSTEIPYWWLGSASDWLNQISHAARPIRSTTQIWVVMRHQYGIAALFCQTSFGGKTSGSVAKSRPFSQASFNAYGLKRFCPVLFPRLWWKIFPRQFHPTNLGKKLEIVFIRLLWWTTRECRHMQKSKVGLKTWKNSSCLFLSLVLLNHHVQLFMYRNWGGKAP